MTCIVGVESDPGAILAGDSACVGNHHTRKSRNSKVLKFDGIELALGYTTSFRMGQILEHHLCPPDINSESERFYAIDVLLPKIRHVLESKGFTKIKNNRKEGGMFLLAVKNKIFKVQKDFSVIRFDQPFFALGTGAREAYGAMAAMKEDNPVKLAQRAVKAAAEFNTSVELPVTVCRTTSV